MTTPREFGPGEQVYDDQGRSGEVSQAYFDFDGDFWIYEVTGLGTVAADFLTGDAPAGLQTEPEPVGDTEDGEPEGDTSEEGFPEAEEETIGSASVGSGSPGRSSGLTRSEVEAIVRSWVNLHRIEVTNTLKDLDIDPEALDNLRSEVDALRDSVSGLVIEQVSLEDRSTAEKEALKDVEETSLGGFIRNVGGFFLSAFDKIKDAFEAYVLSEIRDGLNR